MSFICHIHHYTEYNEEWNVFSAFNPSKCTHLEQWAADCAAPGEKKIIFQQDLAPAHTAKSTKSWLNDHGVGVLDWPANSPDLNPVENLWCIVKRKMRNKRPKNADELKATVKETWASIPPQQCHKLITSMPRRIEAVIKAKWAPTKYWVHIQYMNILSRRPTNH